MMAVAAFKSTTSRKGSPKNNAVSGTAANSSPVANSSTVEPPDKFRPRRSRSVTAMSRNPHPRPQYDSLQVPSDFLYKRDNPLFWSADSPGENLARSEPTIKLATFDHLASDSVRKATPRGASAFDARRGRSVSRFADAAGSKRPGISRSLSRVDAGRRVRSLSQRPVQRAPHRGTSESPICDFGISSSSLSDAEEKTIKAVCEQIKTTHDDRIRGENCACGVSETVRSEVRRYISDIQNNLESAILWHNATDLSANNAADIPPDLFNPGAVELVLDVRSEYARKLEESQERARKLKADLVAEEHRGQELSRILMEILPDPTSSNDQKSRPGRKTSIERREMSKRLTEEALAYFDECVSISTFDGSDFSASEDPPGFIVEASTQKCEGANLPGNAPFLSTYSPNRGLTRNQQVFSAQGQSMYSHEKSYVTPISSSSPYPIDEAGSNTEQSSQCPSSFTPKAAAKSINLQQDIRNCIKIFEKASQEDDVKPDTKRSHYYDADESTQGLLFDRVFFKNRIESGTLLLCAGGRSASFSPFASMI